MQTRGGDATRYYNASPEVVLEEVYDEYASDEVSPGSQGQFFRAALYNQGVDETNPPCRRSRSRNHGLPHRRASCQRADSVAAARRFRAGGAQWRGCGAERPTRRRSSCPKPARLIATGNFDDDLAKIADCDWIIEAVTENLDIKRALYEKAIAHRAPGAIVSTNTSGIPLAQIAEGYPTEFREHFLGAHFFNPPRYLHLVEMIPGADTRPEIVRVRLPISATAISARASCRAKTRRTSSPTGSARSSAPRCSA